MFTNHYGFRLNEKWPLTPGEKLYVCCFCDHQHDQPSRMRKHQVVHSDNFYQCEKCPLKTKHKSYLREHVKYVHMDPATAKQFACEMCAFKTSRASILRRHMITHTSFAKKPKVDMYKCEICSYQHKKKYFVEQHVNIHRPPSEYYIFKCELCSYTSKFKTGVANHMTVHKKSSETTMYECELCEYKSKWPHCLRNHLKTHESKQVPVHKCDHCDFVANNKYSVATHKKSAHKELFEKPKKEYNCDLCDYKGKCTSHITRHRIVHEKITRADFFTCGICGSQMKRKKSLKYHILTLHGYLEKNLGSTP